MYSYSFLRIVGCILFLALFVAPVVATEGIDTRYEAVYRVASDSLKQSSLDYELRLTIDDGELWKYARILDDHDGTRHCTSIVHFTKDPLRGATSFGNRDPIRNSIFTYNKVLLRVDPGRLTATATDLEYQKLDEVALKDIYTLWGFVDPSLHWVDSQFREPDPQREHYRKLLAIISFDFLFPYCLEDDRWAKKSGNDSSGTASQTFYREAEAFVDELTFGSLEPLQLNRRVLDLKGRVFRFEYSDFVEGPGPMMWPLRVRLFEDDALEKEIRVSKLAFGKPGESVFVPEIPPGTLLSYKDQDGLMQFSSVPGGEDSLRELAETVVAYHQFQVANRSMPLGKLVTAAVLSIVFLVIGLVFARGRRRRLTLQLTSLVDTDES